MPTIEDLAQREALARVDPNISKIFAFEFRHPTFGEIIRVVTYRGVRRERVIYLPLEDNAPFNAGESVEFLMVAGEFDEPEINTDVDSTGTLRLDAVSALVQGYIRQASKTNIPIDCTVRLFTFNVHTQTAIGAPSVLHQQARSVAISSTQVAITVGYRNSANQKFPNVEYSAITNPGIVD